MKSNIPVPSRCNSDNNNNNNNNFYLHMYTRSSDSVWLFAVFTLK